MLEVNIFRYYSFGYDYYMLRCQFGGLTYNAAVHRISNYFNFLKELNLSVTTMAAQKLQKEFDSIKKSIAEKTVKGDDVIDDKLSQLIMEIVDKIDATLDAELKLRKAYILKEERVKIEYLLNAPSSLFADETFARLPQVTQYDFTEGCLCLAFNRATASAFHFLRGTEASLKAFYYLNMKRNREATPMWGNMIIGLRKKRTHILPKELLDNLDNIRTNFRNPTQHPEKTYSVDEAQDLLSLTIDVNNRMASHSGDLCDA